MTVAKQPAPKRPKKSAATKSSAAKPRNGGSKKRNELDIDSIERSFAALAPHADALATRFYEELFTRFPAVKPMFAKTDMKKQRVKLIAALKLVVENLRKPRALKKVLVELGRRHQAYGAIEPHYGAVKDTLLRVMEEFAGKLWTRKVAKAWDQAIDAIAKTMLAAYSSEEEYAMLSNVSEVSDQDKSEPVLGDISVLMDIMENSPINVMIADADENIIYVNRRAREVLGAVEDELAQYLPGFKVDGVVGGSIHRYHKDPQAIKHILSGLRPGDSRKGEITPGDFVFEHETRVLTNQAGERIGYIVQWHDMTAQRKKEDEAFRLQRAIDGAQTAMMMIDRDLKITYVNESTKRLLSKYESTLRELYPGFSVDGIIGTCIDIFHKNPAHQRKLLSDPANLPYETDIQVGPLVFNIQVAAMTDLNGNYIGNTLEWADVTEQRAKELEVARLQSAIEGSQTNLMLCDTDLNITYVNPAVVKMLARRQHELQKIYPGFDAHNLVGQNIDRFHKNPEHQRRLLGNKSALPAEAEIKVGDLDFKVNATAIVDADGNLMGNMVEWNDITDQKKAEREIEKLVSDAIAGQLDARLDPDAYQGFLKGLSRGINELMDAIVNPLSEGIETMQALAEGDLTRNMDGEYSGEFKVLSDAVNSTIENLRNMVSDIVSASSNINVSSNEIAQGNANLSQRTEEQASSLEETASSMEELTGTVKQNADNARQANQLASSARSEAEKGGEVARRTIEAMTEINSSSKKIADIIGVIDEIAFQTNLLALNAAVEAARAGEQGRGFAVVASEVRNLAQRSAGAAKEIKSLIKDSVEKVEEGSKLVNDTGKSLDEIVGSVKKVSDIIAEIAAASQEQASGIEQVNKTVMQMDEMTQQNAALVEQAASASASLNDQAEGLNKLMQFFNLGEDVEITQSSGKASFSSAPVARESRPAAARQRSKARPSQGDSDEWEEF